MLRDVAAPGPERKSRSWREHANTRSGWTAYSEAGGASAGRRYQRIGFSGGEFVACFGFAVSVGRLRRRLHAVASVVAVAVTVLVAGSAMAADARAPRRGVIIGSVRYREYIDPQLVSWNGVELFIFSRDTRRSPACLGRCTRVWMPVITSGPPRAKAGSQIRSRQLGTIRRPDGRLQATYYHKPLYRAHDVRIPCTSSGSTHQFGGTFSPINAVGQQPAGVCGLY